MRVFEYTKVGVGGECNNQTLSEKEIEILLNNDKLLKEKKIIEKSFFRWVGRDQIEFLNYAGIVSLDARQIEILPKIFAFKSENETESEKSFIAFARMISYVFNSKKFDKELIYMTESEKVGVLDIIIFFYISSLKTAVKRGIHNQYETEIFESRFIKGKICFNQQINKLPGNAYYQESHIFTSNNELMKYLKSCTLFFVKISQSNWLKQQIHRLSSLFDEVDTVDISQIRYKTITFNRLNSHYQDAYDLSKLILSSMLLKPSSEVSHSGLVFLIDMNKLFENFFATFIEKNLEKLTKQFVSSKVLKRNASKHLFIDRNVSPLIPDIRVLNRSNITELVFDTKYKIQSDSKIQSDGLTKVEKGDLYQMYAYSNKYQAKETILVYPSLKETTEQDCLKFEEAQNFRIWDINLNLLDANWEEELVKDLSNLFLNISSI